MFSTKEKKRKIEKVEIMENKQINGFDFIDIPMLKCPKCSGETFSIEFIPKDVLITRTSQNVTYLDMMGSEGKEYLLIRCQTCKYMYLTNCLDYKDDN
jgi:predicted nucleic-acid-binding Zn-ribbon protein